MSTNNSNSIFLQLGDIIKITSPTNSAYHDKTFFIQYIDNEYMKIINNDFEDILTFSSNQRLNDTSIIRIDLLKRNEFKGFAKQNNLIQGTWVNIYFTGNVPIIVTGFIQSLEEDMIEIKLYPDDSYIYIDFAYKGIPKNLNIEKIEIRNSPSVNDNANIKEDVDDEMENKETTIEELKENETKSDEVEFPGTPSGTPPSELQRRYYEEKEKQQEDSNDNLVEDIQKDTNLDDDKFMSSSETDSDLGEIEQYVKVSEDEMRYGIQIQIDDLTNNLIANNKKNVKNFKFIEKNINRFLLLRDEFSKKDHNDYPTSPLFLGIESKPFENITKDFKNPLPWFIPTFKEKHKIYDVNFNENEFTDVDLNKFLDERGYELEQLNKYNNYSNKVYLNNMYSTFTPYIQNEQYEAINPNIPVDSISHNINVSYSSRVNEMCEKVSLKENVMGRVLPSDSVHFNGFISILDYWLNASRSYLHETSILDKISLLLPSFSNFARIYDKTNLKSVLYDENEYKFNFENMYHVYFDSDKESLTWKDFLHKTLPSNNEIFTNYKDKLSNLSNSINVQSLLLPFSGFNLNMSTIVLEDYDNLLKKIYENRRTYYKISNTNIRSNKKNYDLLRRLQKQNQNFTEVGKLKTNFENYFKGKSKDEKSTIVEFILNSYYQNNEINFNTQYERLLYYTTQDSLDCFTSIINFANIHLLNQDIESLLLKYQEKNTISNDKTNNTCNKDIQIVKKYIDLSELEEDNNKIIYYDKQFDKTYYTALEIYDKERNTMSPSQFKTFLEVKMKEVYQLTDEESQSMVKNILDGKKKVLSGDYCVLEVLSEQDETLVIRFFKRVNDNWEEDKEMNEKMKNNYGLSINNDACLNKLPCYEPEYSFLDVCNDSNDKKKELQRKFIHEMMEEYSHIHSKTKNEFKFIVEDNEMRLKKKKKI